MKRASTIFEKQLLLAVVSLVLLISQTSYCQTQRNPVLEFCTGTWCMWCPCGDSVVHNDILPNIPNAIILAYHGGGVSHFDPLEDFPGDIILSLLDFYYYPTGIVDRQSGIIIDWNVWTDTMQNRLNTPPTVDIEIDQSYNPATREFGAMLEFTALQNLSGEFRFHVILTEDGIVHQQISNEDCTPGFTQIPDYIHDWTVRAMMNGALGDEIITGTWNQNEIIVKPVDFTYSIPPAPAPDINPGNCNVIVIVYKSGTPLNSASEIQQAREWPLVVSTAIEPTEPLPPSVIELNQNFPNPFNPTTVIDYRLSEASRVELSIFNLAGQKIRTLVDAQQSTGTHEARWNGLDNHGIPSVSGIYVCRLRVAGIQGITIATRKMILLR